MYTYQDAKYSVGIQVLLYFFIGIKIKPYVISPGDFSAAHSLKKQLLDFAQSSQSGMENQAHL